MKPLEYRMNTLTAKDAKYGFGHLIDLARAGPVAVSKHGRPFIFVGAVEEFDRLNAFDTPEKCVLFAEVPKLSKRDMNK